MWVTGVVRGAKFPVGLLSLTQAEDLQGSGESWMLRIREPLTTGHAMNTSECFHCVTTPAAGATARRLGLSGRGTPRTLASKPVR
jgi:hypothetical protein